MLAKVCARAHFDASLESRTVFDGHAGRFQIAYHVAGTAKNNALASPQIAFHLSFDENFRGFDVRADMPGLSNSKARIAEADAAVNLSINNEISLSGQLALDANALRQNSGIRARRLCRRRG